MIRPRQLFQRIVTALQSVARPVYHVPFFHGVLRCIGLTVRGFFRDDCHIMAAAISFYAVLSLIPFLLLLFSIAGFVLSHLGDGYADPEGLFVHLETYIRAVVPFLSGDILDRLKDITLHRQAYGITALSILLVTAGLVFRSLELAFARIFRTRQRSFVASQLLFVLFVFGMGLLFLLVHLLGILTSSLYSARDSDFAAGLDQFLAEHLLLRIIVTILSASVVFMVLLKYFSRGKITFRFTIVGGLLFSLLWMVASRVFRYYLVHIARFSLLYGSLATLAIIVVWIFYSSCVLLLCTEFTSVLQSMYPSQLDANAPASGDLVSGEGGSPPVP